MKDEEWAEASTDDKLDWLRNELRQVALTGHFNWQKLSARIEKIEAGAARSKPSKKR
jgi:hypothetical protein